MIRTSALTALALAVALLTGCDEPQTDAGTSAIEQSAPTDDARRAAEKAASTYHDPREGYTPATDLCAVPPCGDAPAKDEPAAAEARSGGDNDQ